MSTEISANSPIYVAGHRGMVGSAITRALDRHGFTNVITKSSKELDLRDQQQTMRFFEENRPEVVVLAAARVGGILANRDYPYQFIHDNLALQTNVINAAHQFDVDRLIFLGSSCIYPREAPQPMREDSLLTGPLESTNEWYAVAKIAGLKMCQALRQQYGRCYFSLMPTNLYGPYDNFDLETSHVLPALIRKFHEALPDGDVELWGSGTPQREFLHVDDLAEAVITFLNNDPEFDYYNVGTGKDISIRELSELIQEITGHTGTIRWDTSKPDGTPRKLLDVSRIMETGWQPKYTLREGIRDTLDWFIKNKSHLKEVHIER